MDIKSKYYIVRANDGYSPCILGNNSNGQRYMKGSVLPNCVGFAWGWWHEICDLKKFNFFGKGDARTMYNTLKEQGCKTGYLPAFGAMMVWDDGDAGHVAIVYKVNSDGTLDSLESGWRFTGYPVKTYHRSGIDWRDGCSWQGKKYKFLGFVYHPCLPHPVEQEYIDMDSNNIVKLTTIYTDNRNYPQLSALADAGYLRASWDAEKHLPKIGRIK